MSETLIPDRFQSRLQGKPVFVQRPADHRAGDPGSFQRAKIVQASHAATGNHPDTRLLQGNRSGDIRTVRISLPSGPATATETPGMTLF